MGLFGPKRPLDADELEWQLAAFQWLIDEFGGYAEHQSTILANPAGEYFPDSTLTGHARAEQLLDEVKALAGIADWPTRLVPYASPRAGGQFSAYIHTVPLDDASAGTFQLVEDGQGGWLAEIRYDFGGLSDQAGLVATFAHELAHYRLSQCRKSIPGGEELHELLTDLAAVKMGFGLFLANSAHNYQARQLETGGHSWQTKRQGYLSERALVTALVISEFLADRDPIDARPFLKPYLAQDLDLACKWFARRDVKLDVESIDLADFGVHLLVGAGS